MAQQNEHDVTVARQYQDTVPTGCFCLADLAYQGWELKETTLVLPFKKPRKQPLTEAHKAFNRCLASFRVKVEHRIRALKIFRILKERYRNRRQRFELRLKLIAGLVNRMQLNYF